MAPRAIFKRNFIINIRQKKEIGSDMTWDIGYESSSARSSAASASMPKALRLILKIVAVILIIIGSSSAGDS